MSVLEGKLQLLSTRGGEDSERRAEQSHVSVMVAVTEADKLARCEGGDLPGLSGHV